METKIAIEHICPACRIRVKETTMPTIQNLKRVRIGVGIPSDIQQIKRTTRCSSCGKIYELQLLTGVNPRNSKHVVTGLGVNQI